MGQEASAPSAPAAAAKGGAHKRGSSSGGRKKDERRQQSVCWKADTDGAGDNGKRSDGKARRKGLADKAAGGSERGGGEGVGQESGGVFGSFETEAAAQAPPADGAQGPSGEHGDEEEAQAEGEEEADVRGTGPVKGFLHVRILAAHDLVNKDTGLFGDLSDPYVAVKVGRIIKKTPLIDNNLNPVWEHDNEFSFTVNEETGTLQLEVFNANTFKDQSLGRTAVPLWRLAPGQWVKMREKLEGVPSGELSFEVRFSYEADMGAADPAHPRDAKPELQYPFGPCVQQPRSAALPLEGARVLELSRRTWTAALCGRMMATYGADVVRVATGEESQRSRQVAAPGGRKAASAKRAPSKDAVDNAAASAVPRSLHRGKRLAPHRLDDQHEMAALRAEILPGCDVLLTDFTVDELDKMQLGFHTLRRQLPGLVYVHVSSVGMVADVAQKGVEDAGAFYCLTGLAEQLGHYLGPTGFAAATAASALFGVVCLSVMRRRCGATGDRVEFSVFRAGRWCTSLGALTKWSRPPRPDLRFGSGAASAARNSLAPFDVEGAAQISPSAAARTSSRLEPLHLRWRQAPETVHTPPAMAESPVSSELPLARVAVIEMSDEYHVSAAAIGCMLADLGAQVTKVERPQRPDPWKKTCKQLYQELNGKKLIQALDYTSVGGLGKDGTCRQGQAAMYRTLAETTMLVTNLPQAALDAWGFGVARLRAMFPHLVVVLVSTWGCDMEARVREVELARRGGQEVHAFWEASGLATEWFANLAMPPGLGELAVSLHALGGIGLALLRQQRTGGGQLVHVGRQQAGWFSRLLSAEAPRVPLASPLLPLKDGRFMRLLARGHRPHDSWMLLQALGLRPSLWDKHKGNVDKINQFLEALSPEELRKLREELVAHAKRWSYEDLARKFGEKKIDWFVEELRPVDAEEVHRQRAQQVEALRRAHQDAVEAVQRQANARGMVRDGVEAAAEEQDRQLMQAYEAEMEDRNRMQVLEQQWQMGVPPEVTIAIERGEGLLSAIKGDRPVTYCVCSILQKPHSRVETPVVHGTSMPEWNCPPLSLLDYVYGDTLVFAVFSKDHDDEPPEQPNAGPELGELFVTVLCAHKLANLDSGLLGNVSDPYVVVRLGALQEKTPYINDNLDPVWTENNQFRFPVAMGDSTVLNLRVMNKNLEIMGIEVTADDSLGWVQLDVSQVEPHQRNHMRLPLMDGQGELEFEVFFKPPQPPPVLRPQHVLDQMIGRADLDSPAMYPRGFAGMLPLYANQGPTGASVHVTVAVRPREMDLRNWQGYQNLPPMASMGPGPMQSWGPGGPPNFQTAAPGMGPGGPSGGGPPWQTQPAGFPPPGADPRMAGGPGGGSPYATQPVAGPPGGAPPFQSWPGAPPPNGPMGMTAYGGGGGGPPASGPPPMGSFPAMGGGPMGPMGMTYGGGGSPPMGGPPPMGSFPPMGGPPMSGQQMGAGGLMASMGQMGANPPMSGPMASRGSRGSGPQMQMGNPMQSGQQGQPGPPPWDSMGAGSRASSGPPPDGRPAVPPPAFEVPVSVLHVRINGAVNLKNKDTGLFGDVSDPYVVARVGEVSQKTPTIDNNLNPVWEDNNYFVFRPGIEDTVLKLEVMNHNMMKDDSLGCTDVDLRALLKDEWCQFRERLQDGGGAELEFDVYFKPTDYHRMRLDFTSMLYVRVIGATKLMNKDTGLFGDVSDPYVKVRVGQTEHRTPTIDNNLNPIWEDGNQFKLAVDDDVQALELEVMNDNHLRHDSLGKASIPFHRMRPEEWCRFQEQLVDGSGAEILLDCYFKPTPLRRAIDGSHSAQSEEDELAKVAEALAKQVQEAEFSAEWLEDLDGKTRLPMSVEEKDWEQACGGRNLVIPAWIAVTQTQVESLQRARQHRGRPVALFLEDAGREDVVKAKVKIFAAEGLHSVFLGEHPNPYCVCEIPLKPKSSIKTPFVPGSSRPEWRHSRSIRGYSPGDSLMFNVYSVDPEAILSGDTGSARPRKRDELLGTASLAGERFYPEGFDGLLNLSLAGRETGATLRVIAFVYEANERP